MSYRIRLEPAAQRQIGRLRGVEYIAIRGAILAFADDPRPNGSAKLSGKHGLWRLRIRVDGRAWRVIYKVDDTGRLVIVTRVARRDEGTYRAL